MSSPSPSSSLTPQQVKSFYNAETAKSYNSMMPEEIPKVEVDLNYLVSYLQQQQQQQNDDSDNIILDVCCGTGDMLLWLHDAWKDKQTSGDSDATSYSWIGNDLSGDMLKIAKEKLEPRPVTLHEGSMEQIDASVVPKDKSCAIILCNFAIHHLKEYQTVLQEMTRLLRPSGVLYLSFWEGTGQEEIENGMPVYYHDPEKVKQDLLEKYGYKVEQERSVEEKYPEFSMKGRYILASLP